MKQLYNKEQKYKKWSLDRIQLISIEWNSWNGFFMDILVIDLRHKDGSLFGINACSEFLYIDILFFKFKIFDKNETT